MTETTQSMRDHWWWQPGWRVGRSLYTWHVTFNDQPAVHQLAADYAPVLNDLPTLDPVPVRWLHLTMQGIGFTDEVDRADVDAITDAARDRCAAIADVWGDRTTCRRTPTTFAPRLPGILQRTRSTNGPTSPLRI
jgi:hypothetical protein